MLIPQGLNYVCINRRSIVSMKKTIRSAIALVLTASMALTTAACSSKNNKKTKKKVISENDPYFEATEKELKVNYDASKEIESASLH